MRPIRTIISVVKATAIAAVCCVVLGVLLARQHVSDKYLQLGWERRDTHVRYMHGPRATYPDIANRHLELLTPSGSIKLTRFRQLQDHVLITTTRQALSYVRFRTSLYTFFYWSDTSEFEVLTENMSDKLSSYGLNRYYKPYSGGEGDAGILSPAAYREGNFTPANVSEQAGHFEVVRWIFVPGKVEKVKESITTDGGFQRTILKQVPPPKLRDTYWRVPSFE